jgi:hypothetical protein
MPFTIVYIYGPRSCEKSKMCREVLLRDDIPDHAVLGVGYGFTFVDHFNAYDVEELQRYINTITSFATVMNYHIVLCSNEPPDDINMHLDKIYFVSDALQLEECRDYLQSIVKSPVENDCNTTSIDIQ